MTRLFNDPARFSDDALAGFVDACARWVVAVPGGVVRTTRTRAGKVAVVVGGGSGHYPAFWGTVGAGFADGAVAGNVFTSPSAAEAASVGRAADGGSGVVMITGNYAGDVLNFGLAAQRLGAEGIDTRYVAVTDDIASASAEEITKRRGIAGDFPVFKAAAAAAEEGGDLDAVVAAATRCNDATRSLGVAFAGCTMPGAREPLFTVGEGMMGVGLGIHGEPGVSEDPMPTADELARRLVQGVLAEAPRGAGSRVAVILNGLGSTKYDELFVLWGAVASLLREAGLELVEPEVGELVTSLDMAGCSLTITWLDEDLERWWRAAADTPAYRKGSLGAQGAGSGEERGDAAADAQAPAGTSGVPAADDAAREAARTVVAALQALAETVAEHEDELGRIDAVAGDGDHGRGMVKGSAAAVAAAEQAVTDDVAPAGVLLAAADAWAARAGGTSGVLWGALLSGIAGTFDDGAAPTAEQVGAGITAGYDALVRLGGASRGDKTMLDSLGPFAERLTERLGAGDDLAAAWGAAAQVAVRAGEDTADMVPKIGRARPLAERSVGTPDAGATSMGMCVAAVARVLADH